MTAAWVEEETGPSSFVAHLPAIAKQRKLLLIVPTIILFIAGVVAAFVLPTSYRSSSILLVESPQMQIGTPGDQSNEAIDQRVAKVRQQVLSRPDLIEMIQRLDLYTKERNSEPLSKIIEKLRDSVTFAPVGAEFTGGGGGKSTTIAFSMSVDYPDPVKAQAAAQDIVDRILRIDSTKNAEQAQDTVQFLQDQSSSLETQIAALESQISGIKARNGSALSSPGMAMFGSGGNYDAQIAMLRRENTSLNSQRDLTKTAANRDPVVAAAEQQLASARAVYAETHPDVVIAKQRLAEAKELAARCEVLRVQQACQLHYWPAPHQSNLATIKDHISNPVTRVELQCRTHILRQGGLAFGRDGRFLHGSLQGDWLEFLTYTVFALLQQGAGMSVLALPAIGCAP